MEEAVLFFHFSCEHNKKNELINLEENIVMKKRGYLTCKNESMMTGEIGVIRSFKGDNLILMYGSGMLCCCVKGVSREMREI